jgi:heavy metal-binding protein
MKRLLVALAVLLAACGGKQTMASRSAAAFREAGTKDVPVASDRGHVHEQPVATDTSQTAAHAGHATTPADHAAMGHAPAAGPSHAGHSAARPGAASHSEHRPSNATSAPPQHDQHAAAEKPMDHGAMAHGSAPAANLALGAPLSSADMASVQPPATLRADELDAPAPISAAEAAKPVSDAGHEGHAPAAQPAQTPNDEPRQQTTIYTCPMHPEVTSSKPGTCPKCGMTLVRKAKP